jgi:hypothetical protein
MSNYNIINILKRQITLGNLLAILFTFVSTVTLHQCYVYFLDYYPIKGELETVDVSFFTLVLVFRIIIKTILEHLLEDKFYIPLTQVAGGGKNIPITFNADNINPGGSAQEGSGNTNAGNSTQASSFSLKTYDEDCWASRSIILQKMGNMESLLSSYKEAYGNYHRAIITLDEKTVPYWDITDKKMALLKENFASLNSKLESHDQLIAYGRSNRISSPSYMKDLAANAVKNAIYVETQNAINKH